MHSLCACTKQQVCDSYVEPIKQFTGSDMYKSGLIAYFTHFYTDLTHFHLSSHSY